MSRPFTRTWQPMVALLACLLLAACGRSVLYNELEEQQANQVMAALLASGVAAEKAPSSAKKGWEVQVDQADFAYAMQVLDSRGLPGTSRVTLCDVFRKEGFASSALEERARYKCGQQQEIESTLMKIDGVVDARVHVAIPEDDPLGNDARQASASVVIYELPGYELRNRETDVKVLVVDGIEYLNDPNRVSVKFFTRAVPPAAAREQQVAVTMSAMNPLALGVLALIALVGGLVAMRKRLPLPRRAEARNEAPSWKDE